MRLLKLRLTNYRRFAKSQPLDLNEELIALVGPNEAGKTTILRALDLLGRVEVPSAADRTRGASGPATVEALFFLEPSDRAAIADIHDAEVVTHAWLRLVEGQRPSWKLEDAPKRDLAPRARCAELLAAIDGDPALRPEYSNNQENPWSVELLTTVQGKLELDSETLDGPSVEQIEDLVGRLRDITHPPLPTGDEEPEELTSDQVAAQLGRESAASALAELVGIERLTRPAVQVSNVLNGRLPEIAFFGEADRTLASDYVLAEVFEEPPPALENLCAVAELDLAVIQSNIEAGQTGEIEKAFEDANARLKASFRAWTQSDVYPRFATPDAGVLRIYVSTETGTYSHPHERSDGLLWFMALYAFLIARGEESPILLVDEAERHLHYDAQADVIDVLMTQAVASKVIYTTHSVGCLPPDLGCGIRVVLVEPGEERSRIANSYWSVDTEGDDRIGYTPLLFAMGARLLSLTVPRFAVVAEGPADAVLLPSLFRDAVGLPTLRFRIVPGLSELATDGTSRVEHHAGSVACLTDGDAGGRAIRRKLGKAGMPSARIFDLGKVIPGGAAEDLVAPEVFARAVNLEIETWAFGPWRVESACLPATGRWQWLIAEGTANETLLDDLNKIRVAQRIVDLSRRTEPGEDQLRPVIVELREPLAALHSELERVLGLKDAPTRE